MRHILSVCFVLLAAFAPAQQKSLRLLYDSIPSNIRAVSAVSDEVVWISGSKGYIARSTDGGNSFTTLPVPGQDSSDFRSLYAFDDQTAIVANTGSPAKVFLMTDGQTWSEVYSNEHREAFFDGIDFWNTEDGIIYGDPIDNQLMLLRTTDGGRSWLEVPEAVRPLMVPGEASFAASGTAIRCVGKDVLMIATGGVVSRLLISDDKGDSWTSVVTPMLQGVASAGTFSLDVNDELNWVIVGGDYTNDTLAEDHVFYTTDGGNSWQRPVNPTRGYRECVMYADANTLIAVGPSGADISMSGARNWDTLSDVKGLHVVRKARNGSRIFVAGKNVFGVVLKK